MPIDRVLSKRAREELCAALNTLLASPSLPPGGKGALDVRSWLALKNGRTPTVIVSVAHLDDDERALVLGVLPEEVLTWVRRLPGSKKLHMLIVFDEVYGFLPPLPPVRRRSGRSFH